ncbi:ECF transporter S component [Kineosporia sp. J2-2]|uniref:ECF transporter S component n=1 Tax=Kineosporia corallincola TaxID=2835133 RepID=A0ABS5TNC8_9ACTN|nr:ECF transporter S component [Kineosporia corallincola]MBT0772612.1 ECF transporter S component [Kineosporia corallincola]
MNTPWAGPRLFAAGAAVAVALAVYLIGLPEGTSLFGTPLSDLTLPTALFVATAGVAVTASTARAGRWRVVDIVTASVLGVAGGLVFAVWNAASTPLRDAMVPPASAIIAGVWLFPAVLGALVVRRPGAAVYTELVAAVLSALVGNEWGFATVWYGLVEGMGAEVVFALLLYRRYGLPTALFAGAGAGVAVGLLDSLIYYPETLGAGGKLAYVLIATASGVVIAGLGSWLLTRALASTGTLAPLASGRSAERV